jgi:FSR family fosmidomycin resistance protein-like MFS transporter
MTASESKPESNASDLKFGFSSSLVLGHVVNDTSSNSLSGLLPVLIASYGLSYLLAGVVATVFNITSSILQPLLGHWFDRSRVAWLLEAGVAVNCIGIGLIGLSPTYTVLLLLVGIGGLGSAAFHPPAFSAVVESSSSTRGRAMGMFVSGGNIGFFLGPLVVGLLVSAFGLPGMLLLVPVGLTTAFFLLRIRPTGGLGTVSAARQAQPAKRGLLVLLATITAFRSVAIQSAVTFLPIYFVAKGNSLLVATSIASLWLAVGVLGQIGGGMLSDRIGRRPVVAASLLAGALFFYGFLTTTGSLSLVLLAVAGALLYASWSVIVVMSSEAAPSHVGAVTGFMLGFSVGIGGLAVLGFGAAADIAGLAWAFNFVIAFAFAGGLLSLFLPRRVQASRVGA